jgi:serine/threonine-protein kinase
MGDFEGGVWAGGSGDSTVPNPNNPSVTWDYGFGIVKTELNTSATAAGVVKGKYPYMSPEQIRAEPIDHRSDIFSLGVVLYEVATGVALFRRRSLVDTIAAVAHAQVRRPTEFLRFPPSSKGPPQGVVLAREDRFQSFAELGQALDSFRSSRN